VAIELANGPDMGAFVTGGFLRAGWFSLAGETAIEAVGYIFVDKLFIESNELHAEHGTTAYHPEEAARNSAAVWQAREKIVAVNRGKLGVLAMYPFCPIREVNRLITDTAAFDDMAAGFVGKGMTCAAFDTTVRPIAPNAIAADGASAYIPGTGLLLISLYNAFTRSLVRLMS
jgi:DeoR family transcriptional regulator, aga operon transcriptional repressor